MASLLWIALLICVAAPSVTGKDVALGDACTAGDACTPPTSTSLEVICDQTGFCKLKKDQDCSGANTDKCVAGAECPLGTHTCTCKTPTYVDDGVSGKCKSTTENKFLGPCPQDGTCTGEHLKCDTTATPKVCLCDDIGAFFPNLTSGTCSTAKPVTTPPKSSNGPGGPTVPGVTTKTTKATTATPEPGALFGTCDSGNKCSDGNAECKDNYCTCKPGFYAKGSSCTEAGAGKVGGSCDKDPDCNDKETTCKSGFCSCNTGFHGDAETGCAAALALGGTCDSGTCVDKNAFCQTRGTGTSCQCNPHYYVSNKKCVKSGSASLTSVTSLALVALFWASRHLLKE